MKTKSKALLLALCAVLLVVASVLGTLAYLTDDDKVVNTFTVGSVIITLDELDTDSDNNEADNRTYGEGDNAVVRDKANGYKLLPGHQYTKDPIIHVDSNSENCYLFVKVVNQIADIEADTKVADQMTGTYGWTVVDGVNGLATGEVLYVYTNKTGTPVDVAGGNDVVVFKTFKIDGDVNNDTLAAYAGKTITVTACAVQKDGFENSSAADIWNTAFGTPALQG